MLRDAKKNVDKILADLPAGKQEIRRAQLEQTRSRLLAEQAVVFERLGDIVEARRARAASRSAGLSGAADAALLRAVGKGPQGQFLYESALQVSQRQIDAALARMKLSQLPLSQRIYKSSVWMGARLGKLINETLASGLNAQEFAKRARDWFDPNTPGGVRFAAMRLARTEINNSFHAMTAARAAEEPWVNEVEWNLSKSHPKPDVCNEVNAKSPFPSDKVPARPHPQCMCYITPKPVDEDDFIDAFLKGDYDEYLDSELKKNGWEEPEPVADATVAKAPTAPAPIKMLTEAVAGNPKGDGDPQFTSLKDAGVLEVGSEFLYHGDAKKRYTIFGKHVRVAPPTVGNKPEARTLVDVKTGQVIGQQASSSAKWWVEKIVDTEKKADTKPTTEPKTTPSGKVPAKSTRPEDQPDYYIPRMRNEARPAHTIQNQLVDGKTGDEAIAAAVQKFNIPAAEATAVYNDVLRRYSVPNHVAQPKSGGSAAPASRPASKPTERPVSKPSEVKPAKVRPEPRKEPLPDAPLSDDLRGRIDDSVKGELLSSAKKVLAHQEKFVGSRIKRVTTINRKKLPNEVASAAAVTNYFTGEITLRPDLDSNTKKSALRRSLQSGHLCNHDHTEIDGVIAHEVGHAMLNHWDLSVDETEELVTGLGRIFGLQSLPQRPDKGAYGLALLNQLVSNPENKAILSSKVSKFAPTNVNELIAEIWTGYTMRESPSRELREAGELLQSLIARKPEDRTPKPTRRRK